MKRLTITAVLLFIFLLIINTMPDINWIHSLGGCALGMMFIMVNIKPYYELFKKL